RDDVAAAVGTIADGVDDIGELVDMAAIRCRPAPPLAAIDRAEIAVLVGPFVPDRDAALLQPAYIGFAANEPEQFVDDRLAMQLLGCDQRKALREIEAHLVAEDRPRAGSCAVG